MKRRFLAVLLALGLAASSLSVSAMEEVPSAAVESEAAIEEISAEEPEAAAEESMPEAQTTAFTTLEEAGACLRNCMIAREGTFTLRVDRTAGEFSDTEKYPERKDIRAADPGPVQILSGGKGLF